MRSGVVIPVKHAITHPVSWKIVKVFNMKKIGYTFIYTVEKLGVGLKTMEKWLAAAILRHKRDKNVWIFTFEITFFRRTVARILTTERHLKTEKKSIQN